MGCGLSHTITTTSSIQYQDEAGMRVVDGHTCILHRNNIRETLTSRLKDWRDQSCADISQQDFLSFGFWISLMIISIAIGGDSDSKESELKS